MTADSEVFNGFVYGGQDYPPQCVEQAVRAVQRQLSSAELRRVNGALLARLAQAKKTHPKASKKEMLDDPGISTLVNTLALVNQAWITTVIAGNIKSRKHWRGRSAEEHYSTALTGGGAVGGVMNAILTYDYETCGVDAFSHYLARAITNALLPTPKEKESYRRVESRTRPIDQRDEDGTEPGWVDRTAPRPDIVASNRELLAVVQSAIDGLKSKQQRATGAWMIERILATGELPMAREAAQRQNPPGSHERGRQIMEATINSITRQIAAACPHLAEQGLNGWDQFKEAFTRTRPASQSADTSTDRAGREA